MQKLGQNMPNPFNPTTRIGYSLSIASTAQLMITDVRGRVVRTLVQTHQEAGDYVAIWDGRDDHGHRVASGVYFYHLKAAGRVESRRMVVAR